MIMLKESFDTRIERMRREAEAKLSETSAETDKALSSVQSHFESQVCHLYLSIYVCYISHIE